MSRRTVLAAGVLVRVWFLATISLGMNTAGVYLDSRPVVHAEGSAPQPGDPPTCVSARVSNGRGWGGLHTLYSEVRLTGCNNSRGQLRLTSGPTCYATSFLGPGTASCTPTNAGRDLKVVFKASYPFELDNFSGQAQSMTFRISPEGGYSSR